jgi:hypothetical protein
MIGSINGIKFKFTYVFFGLFPGALSKFVNDRFPN